MHGKISEEPVTVLQASNVHLGRVVMEIERSELS